MVENGTPRLFTCENAVKARLPKHFDIKQFCGDSLLALLKSEDAILYAA